ncbi:MAG: gluconokinase [Verrucomicrobiota bacterium]
MKLVIAGVSGVGKTTVGCEVARQLGVGFLDGDDFHSLESVAKMASGVALGDDDREKWLTALGERLAGSAESAVLACSALKRAYRDRLRQLCPGIVFILLKADEDLIRERLDERVDHFMPTSLLESQLAILEEGADVSIVGNLGTIEEVAADCIRRARMRPGT